MKNNCLLKRILSLIIIVSICYLSVSIIIREKEYKTYNYNFNNKIDMILGYVKSTYPDIIDEELFKIINNENNTNLKLENFGYDLNNDSVILKNKNSFKKYLILNTIFAVLTITILVVIIVLYDKKNDKELDKIIKYIEAINRKNYSIEIDEISEDKLSILKNEIYKTTVMLKENADNSLKDKIELKKSLEDISHQIKTPLTSISVILDNLIDDPEMDDKIRQDFIRDIKREVGSIIFLVQSLLKISKFESNAISFIKSEYLLKDIVKESIKNVSVLCDIKNINLELNGDENASINCDFMWEIEAITNILKNCAEYSKEKSKIIINYNQNNVYSEISIQDFAGGINKEDLPHIFERFYKGQNSSKDSVGIGLALAKTIVEKDNGTIIVETSEIGSKFIIKFLKLI